MTNSILEITDKEYLIKLNRSSFNLSFIRSLLKIVEVAGPEEEILFDKPGQEELNKKLFAEPEYYSSLAEK